MKIDVRGLSCPQPVILTMKAMKDNQSPLEVTVDTTAASENVQRLAKSKGYEIAIEQVGENFVLTLTK